MKFLLLYSSVCNGIKWVSGDLEKVVVLSRPGGGGDCFHIMLDNYYHGIVHNTLQGWRVEQQSKDPLFTADEIAIIIEKAKGLAKQSE